MRVRTLTGIAIVVTLIPTIFFGDWVFFAVFALFSVFGIREFLVAPGAKKYSLVTKVVVYLFVLSFVYWTFVKNALMDQSYFSDSVLKLPDLFVSLTGIIVYLLLLFLIGIVDKRVSLSDITYLFTVGVLLAIGFQSLFFLRYFPNCPGILYRSSETLSVPWSAEGTTLGTYFKDYYAACGFSHPSWMTFPLFAFLLIGTWMSDAGAYFFGMFFGKHRMNPRISPHKTWEGFFGGMLVSLLFSLGFAALMEYVFRLPLVPGLLQFEHSPLLERLGVFKGAAWPFLVLSALAMPTVGNLGGFLFSLIKRTYGIKDYGKFFPGHGGIIDRFDSVFTSAMIIAVLLELLAVGWRFTV